MGLLTSGPPFGAVLDVEGLSLTELEFASGRVDRGESTPLNLFMNIRRGSDIFGKGWSLPGKCSTDTVHRNCAKISGE